VKKGDEEDEERKGSVMSGYRLAGGQRWKVTSRERKVKRRRDEGKTVQLGIGHDRSTRDVDTFLHRKSLLTCLGCKKALFHTLLFSSSLSCGVQLFFMVTMRPIWAPILNRRTPGSMNFGIRDPQTRPPAFVHMLRCRARSCLQSLLYTTLANIEP
jgi:hypothetical protein